MCAVTSMLGACCRPGERRLPQTWAWRPDLLLREEMESGEFPALDRGSARRIRGSPKEHGDSGGCITAETTTQQLYCAKEASWQANRRHPWNFSKIRHCNSCKLGRPDGKGGRKTWKGSPAGASDSLRPIPIASLIRIRIEASRLFVRDIRGTTCQLPENGFIRGIQSSYKLAKLPPECHQRRGILSVLDTVDSVVSDLANGDGLAVLPAITGGSSPVASGTDGDAKFDNDSEVAAEPCEAPVDPRAPDHGQTLGFAGERLVSWLQPGSVGL